MHREQTLQEAIAKAEWWANHTGRPRVVVKGFHHTGYEVTDRATYDFHASLCPWGSEWHRNAFVVVHDTTTGDQPL